MRKLVHRRIALPLGLLAIGSLCTHTALGRESGEVAFSSKTSTPYLELRAEDDVHHVDLTLEGYQAPMVTLNNPNPEAAVELQIMALGKEGRRLIAELEPGGRSSFTLESRRPFERLFVIARGAFEGVVEDLVTGREASLEVVRLSDPQGGGDALASSSLAPQSCTGVWTLSCISPSSCTYVSPPRSGRVYGDPGPFSHHDVYWNLHTPNGSWRTIANGCVTFWQPNPSKPGCPATAYNCYGQLYSVSGAVSLE